MIESVLGIFGIGGHGRECAWLAAEAGIPKERLRFIVDCSYDAPSSVTGIPVMSPDKFSQKHGGAPVVVAIGGPEPRRKIVSVLRERGHRFPTLVSPRALISPQTRVGEGVLIFPGCVVSVDTVLEDHVHVNTMCSISHDCCLRPFATLAPHAVLCGWVEVGAAAFIGANASVKNGSAARRISIGDRAVVGAGACVVSDVRSGSVVTGVPARTRVRLK